MTTILAKYCLLPDGWHENIIINIGDNGYIRDVINADKTESWQSKASNIEQQDIVIPGMVNCHSHIFQRCFAGHTEYRQKQGDSFWSWRTLMYQFAQTLNPDDLYSIACQVYMEMLKAGYTQVGEFHYLHHQINGKSYDNPAEMSLQIIHAAQECGIGLSLLPVYYAYSDFNHKEPLAHQQRFVHDMDNFYSLLKSLIQNHTTVEQINIGIAPHSLRAVDIKQLNQILINLHRENHYCPVHIHIAEQAQEVEACQKIHQSRPVNYLLNEADVNEHWCLIHATHINKEEMAAIARQKAIAGLCPTTEANLGDGLFPTRDFLQQQGRIAIGSDSHISINPYEECRLLEYNERLKYQQRNILADEHTPSVGQYIYQLAADNGAKSLAVKTGCIARDYRADLVTLDILNPALAYLNKHHIMDAVIFSSGENPVKDVMVAGQWQIKNKHHQKEAEYFQNYRRVVSRVFQSL